MSIALEYNTGSIQQLRLPLRLSLRDLVRMNVELLLMLCSCLVALNRRQSEF